MTDRDAITAAQEAWRRLRRVGQTTWEDWVLVARALAAGRERALRLAQTNKPHGKKYTLAMRQWIDANGFGEMTQPERHSCHRVLQNLPAITAWRNSLGESHRRKINHPDSAFWGWKRSGSPAPKRRVSSVAPEEPAMPKPSGRAIYWPQEVVRRTADAMRETRSNDWFILARVALCAAIRSDVDLVGLLTMPPKPRRAATPACEPAHA